MAQRGKPREILSKLADVGEEAIQRVGEMPGAGLVTDALTSMRDRMDELQKRVRGLDDLEQRLTALEKRVDELGRRRSAPSSRAPARKAADTRRTSSPTRSSPPKKDPPKPPSSS